jgi:hypothetical protein
MRHRAVLSLACVLSACVAEDEDELATSTQALAPYDTYGIPAAPASAVPVPADYDGDHRTDVALKGDNGVWYIDVALCSEPGPETACADVVDDDLDELFNDGCPASGSAETQCSDQLDSDQDGVVNDGCPAAGRRCQGADGFGGRWDFVYTQYGDASAIPVPADYDRDGRADLAVKDGDTGTWSIDYAVDGFGVWNKRVYSYGDATAVPVPADYDGDQRADLAVKNAAGQWLIDYAGNGFGSWDPPNAGCSPNTSCAQLPAIYGGASWTPVPADYNGDGRADLAIKNTQGQWKIDYSNVINTGFGAWGPQLSNYGGANAVPVPFNYDPWRGPAADLAIKDANTGYWHIDYAGVGGFGAWNQPCAGQFTGCSTTAYAAGYGGSWSRAVPGDYDYDGVVDLSVKDTSGVWYMDLGSNGWFGWDPIPGMPWSSLNNTTRALVDTTKPYVAGMTIRGPDGAVVTPGSLKIGVRYTVEVEIDPGVDSGARGASCASGCPAPLSCDDTLKTCEYPAGLEVNADLRVPASLHVQNSIAGTRHISITTRHTRRFAFTCSEWGSFPLGFRFKENVATNGQLAFANPDYGLRVVCDADGAGLYGRAMIKVLRDAESACNAVDDDIDGLVDDGCPLAGATVTAGNVTVNTGNDGRWSAPSVSGGPHRVTVSKPGYAPVIAVNVRAPSQPVGEGVQVDTVHDELFANLAPLGISYATYIDYSRGRTILHAVTVDVTRAPVKVVPNTPDPATNGTDYRRLIDIASSEWTPLMINAGYWNPEGDSLADVRALGYFFSQGYQASEVNDYTSSADHYALPVPGEVQMPVLQPQQWLPMFGVAGAGEQQQVSIVMTPADFLSLAWPWMRSPSDGTPIYDAALDQQSDFSYAVQAGPVLLLDGRVVNRDRVTDRSSALTWDYAFPRTAVGTDEDGTTMWIVIADGEGINGGQGATFNQLGEFFRDILGATVAMNFDGGESTELLLRGAGGVRRINTLTSENASADGFVPTGRVYAYLSVGE